MKIKRASIAIVFCILSWCKANNPLDANKLHIAATNTAAALSLYKEHFEKNNLLTLTIFENDIEGLIRLSDAWENPELAQKLLGHFSFTINGKEIPLNHEEKMLIRKDKPYLFEIIAKRGKIASLVAFIKSSLSDIQQSMADHIKFMCLRALDILSFRISYECPVEPTIKRVYMANLVCQHKDVRPFLEKPNLDILYELIRKEGLHWKSWFDIGVHLSELKKI